MSAKPDAILFVGGGRMASAMLAGFAAGGVAAAGLARPVVIDPALPVLPAEVVADVSGLPDGFVPSLVVLAVKPQVAEAVIAGLPAWHADVLSIMAGKTLGWLRAGLPGAGKIVRAMPNTPGAIGRGISVAVGEPGFSRAGAEAVLAALGELHWVDDEGLIDAVTAVSGGGPAYVFLLTELLEAAAVAEGIPPALAARLARVTVSGSGALLEAAPDDPATLRRNVTSPGGTTEQAIAVLTEVWPGAMRRAIAAATARSRALG